ncbi:MAG: hypothetical protein AB1Z23_03365 [Eubacteriales bacterium]
MGKRRAHRRAKKKLSSNDSYNDVLMIYQSMLINMGVVPSLLDMEDAEVVLDVMGAKKREKLEFIDML